MPFLCPVANLEASKVARAPEAVVARNTVASSTVTSPYWFPAPGFRRRRAEEAPAVRDRPPDDEGPAHGGDSGDPVAGDVLGQIHGVRADIAQRTRPGPVLLQPPRHRCGRIGQPVLQITRPDVAQRADGALSHQVGHEPHGGYSPVSEAAHRVHTPVGRPAGGLRHRLGFGDRVRERLLAQARAYPPRARRSRSPRECRRECRCRRCRRRSGRSGGPSPSRCFPSRTYRPRPSAGLVASGQD